MNEKGVKSEDVAVLRKQYGSNELSKVKGNGFFKLLLESLGDPIIKILLVALAIKVVFLFRDFDWFETLGILIAVFLATFISTISEYGSEAAFQRLQEESSKILVKVIRDGVIKEIPIASVVVKDLVLLNSGDKVPADGYLISGNLSVDESSLNGESKEAMKYAALSQKIAVQNEVYRGTVVINGEAKMLVTKVGDQTFYGNLAREVQESEPESPLKMRLRGLAKVISRIGYIGAFFVTISYLFSVVVLQNNFDWTKISSMLQNFPVMMDHLIYALTLSVTIIVVAVPEGLPMMITLVLSSNMKRMLKSNVLVRKMTGIETTGSLNYLLTDKTGTLTKGKLEVTGLYDANLKRYQKEEDIQKKPKYYEKIFASIRLNNSAMYNEEQKVIGGNSTDRSLLAFVHDRPISVPILSTIPFDSKNKYSAVTVLDAQQELTYIKGASEKLIPHCTKYLNELGEEKFWFHKEDVLDKMSTLTQEGNRLLTLVYQKGKLEQDSFHDLVFLGFVCIRDELREEAREGIENIKSAGIQMIMITEDHKDTAALFVREGGLVTINKDLVNDAPALKKANVGFAMGSGTEVSKEASDIVILDDNILSISIAILYGRTIFKSIRKFIIYQLTCNMCALTLSIIGPFIGVNTPITIIQMLWINMIMDTFAGLAFSFEPALLETMKEPPKQKNEPIMNGYMYSQIVLTGIYSALLCIFFLKAPIVREFIRTGEDFKYLMTAYFALFIFIGVCNAFNARTHRLNLLAHLRKNIVFVITIMFICMVQIYLIYHGGDLFRTYGLTAMEFGFVLVLAFTVIPFDFLRKFVMKRKGFKIGV